MMISSPTCTVVESAAIGDAGARRHPIELQERQVGGRLGRITRADTVSPPRNSTEMVSIEWTTWAAVMTLPSLEMRTPEPVSVKPIWPPLVTSRPLARMTATEGVTFLKRSRTDWASLTRGAPTTILVAAAAMSIRSHTREAQSAVQPWSFLLLRSSAPRPRPSSAER